MDLCPLLEENPGKDDYAWIIIPPLEGTMNRYQTNQELPAQVRVHLSESAQDFYRVAYNSAIQWSGDALKAHHCAWSAVRSQMVSLNGTF